MALIRIVLGLALILASFAVMALGVAFIFTLILWPIGMAIISAGATIFALGVAVAGGYSQ